jgi:hypothetical protein
MNGTTAARAEQEARHELKTDPGRPLAHEHAIHAYLAGEAYEGAAQRADEEPVVAQKDEADAATLTHL